MIQEKRKMVVSPTICQWMRIKARLLQSLMWRGTEGSEEIHEKRRLEKVVVEDRTQSSSFSLQSVIKQSVIKHSFKCFHKDKGKLFNMKTKGQQARIERIFLHKYFTTDKRWTEIYLSPFIADVIILVTRKLSGSVNKTIHRLECFSCITVNSFRSKSVRMFLDDFTEWWLCYQ